MKKFTLQLLAVVLFFAISGCGLNKMVDDANLINYQVDPDPLELKDGKVPVSITVTFPSKYFNKKAYLVVTPTLATKDGTGEIEMHAQTLQGEKVQDNNPIIYYSSGGSYTYIDTIDYSDPYRMSDLQLKVSANKGGNGKSYSFASVTIAHGVITTPLLVDEGLKIDNGTVGNTDQGLMNTITPSVTLPQSSTQSQTLVLYYPLQKDRLTSTEKRKADVDSFLNSVIAMHDDADINFQDITVASYASPDGPQDLNADLVQGRGDNSADFLVDEFDDAGFDQGTQSDFLTRSTTTDEDWDGFKNAVQASNMADKDLILRVLQMYSDPDIREREIKKLAAVYDELRNEILPQLRRSEVVATYQTRQRTSAELINLGKTNPDNLAQIELFYASNTATGTDKETILKNYTASYTDDWKGFNNLGVYYIESNQLDEAELQLQKAETIDANNAAVLNNMGVLYWAKGDVDKAAEYFKRAAQIDPNDEINYNLGVICIKKGNYETAVDKFGNSPSYNKSLAQLLAGNTADAIATLASVNSDEAFFYYLKAVEAARNGNEIDVFSNLQKAVAGNSALKEYALNDMEFRLYFEDDTFKSIVQ